MAAKSQQQYFLRWDNYGHQITHAFDNLRTSDDLVDVTLCCEGKKIKAHKVMLSACSGYFKEAFRENPHPHPFILFKFVKFEELLALIEFMYQGEVNIKQEGLQSFLQTADLLSVHGLKANGVETPESQPSQIQNRLNSDRYNAPSARGTKNGILHINPDRSENLNLSNTSPESQSSVLHLIPAGLQSPHTLITKAAKKRKITCPQDHDGYITSEFNFKEESLDQSIEDANDEQGPISSYIDLLEKIEMSDSETQEYTEIIDDSEIYENYEHNYSTAVIDSAILPRNSVASSKGGVNSAQATDEIITYSPLSQRTVAIPDIYNNYSSQMYPSASVRSSKSMGGGCDCMEDVGEIKKKMNSVEGLLGKLLNEMTTLSDLYSKNFDNTEENDLEAIFKLPMQEIFEIEEFEKKLVEDLNFQKCVEKRLRRCGGRNPNATGRNICSILFVDKLLENYSWTGTAQKRRFANFKQTLDIFCEAQRISFPNYTDYDASNFFKEYLKQTSNRLKKIDKNGDPLK